jgi:phospholipase D1/2
MAGKPFKVGRFAHSLRVRLMREHIGIDVDALDHEDTPAYNAAEEGDLANVWDPNTEQRRARGSVPEKSRHAEKAKNVMRDTVRQGDIRHPCSNYHVFDVGLRSHPRFSGRQD